LLLDWRIKGEYYVHEIGRQRNMTAKLVNIREVLSQTSLFDRPQPHSSPRRLLSFGETSRHNRDAANRRRYGIKEHLASQLHYDFRLGFEGVLLSWVLPYGPSIRVGERRIAILVGDHQYQYLTSERVIPEGRYGAGPVLLWDEGFWIALRGYEDIPKCLCSGRLKFILESHKLNGIWTLQRRRSGSPDQPNQNWDLIKERDQFASGKNAPDITLAAPYSVLSGRTLDELKQYGNKKPVKRASMPLLFDSDFEIL
jgi:DNA ligase D-like protein (predicted 3'-phosphoesterase)